MNDTFENLQKRIMILNTQVWENRLSKPKIQRWLDNFTGKVTDVETEQLHALFWLSQFMYFGGREIRVLLKSLYRDMYFCPMLQEVREKLPPGTSQSELADAVRDEIRHTRFFGIGNPSESGIHLLYYFRQENGLGKKLFMDAVQIFKRAPASKRGLWQKLLALLSSEADNVPVAQLRKPEIRRYVFLDDICGSGETAITYSQQVLRDLLALNPHAQVAYYCLFATEKGLERVRNESLFANNCGAVYELDSTYRCLDGDSRYLKITPPDIDPDIARQLVREYGDLLDPDFACGYDDSQMLMGFHHNTPDNTLGMFWHESPITDSTPWIPIFKRYPKIYGEML